MKPNFRFYIWLGVSVVLVSACKPQSTSLGGSAHSTSDRKNLSLMQGMEIQLHRSGNLNSPEAPGWQRQLTIDSTNGPEGLSFSWKDVGADNKTGKMILANTVDSRRLTLPLFWPDGELFLSNSTALWLSDHAFSELKKNDKAQWDIGLVDNPLLGPAQGQALLEIGLNAYRQGLSTQPEKKNAALQWEVSDDSVDYVLKVNGGDTKVSAIEASNGFAKILVLDNPRNPLVLQVEIAPSPSPASAIFLPLTWMRGALSYKVEAISLPAS